MLKMILDYSILVLICRMFLNRGVPKWGSTVLTITLEIFFVLDVCIECPINGPFSHKKVCRVPMKRGKTMERFFLRTSWVVSEASSPRDSWAVVTRCSPRTRLRGTEIKKTFFESLSLYCLVLNTGAIRGRWGKKEQSPKTNGEASIRTPQVPSHPVWLNAVMALKLKTHRKRWWPTLKRIPRHFPQPWQSGRKMGNSGLFVL